MSSERVSDCTRTNFQSGLSSFRTFNNFRSVILCAIAEAWANPQFKQDLESKPIEALKSQFAYTFPFDLELVCDPNSAVYEPEVANDWVAKQFSSVTINLPPAPSVEERGVALATYNEKHMTFLKARPVLTPQEILSLLERPESKEILRNIIINILDFKPAIGGRNE